MTKTIFSQNNFLVDSADVYMIFFIAKPMMHGRVKFALEG